MRDVTAEGGLISKSIKRIFQSGEIIDEDQEKHWAQNNALGLNVADVSSSRGFSAIRETKN